MDLRRIDASFYQHFRVVPVYTEALKDIAYRIRYQVYCEELGFEDSQKFPDDREIDNFDRHSEHCLLLHRASNHYVGCVRLVPPDPQNLERPLPFEAACPGLDPAVIWRARNSRGEFGEISRLALLPIFRHRNSKGLANGLIWGFEAESGSPSVSSDGAYILGGWKNTALSSRQCLRHISLGLYLAGSAMVLTKGLRGAFVMMEPRLARRLRQYGICFRQVGNMINYRGVRGPFELTTKGLLARLCPGPRRLLDNLLEELKHSNPFELAVS